MSLAPRLRTSLHRVGMPLAIGFLMALSLPLAAEEGHAPGGGTAAEAAGHSHEKASLHGGEVTMTQEFHTEAVFLPSSLRVYLYSPAQEPLSMKGVTGGAVVETKG